MDPFTEVADGDIVVVCASRAPDGNRPKTDVVNYTVVEWGAFALVSDRLTNLLKVDACLEARHCAAERGKAAWDSTGRQMVRLPRLPLVYRGMADRYAVSVDVTDYTGSHLPTSWRSMSPLNEAEALNAIVADGVSMAMAKALLGKAVMPLACS